MFHIQAQWAGLERLFALGDIDPLNVFYENLLDNSNTVCRQVRDFVGIETGHVFSLDTSRTKKQGGALNREWIARAKADLRY